MSTTGSARGRRSPTRYSAEDRERLVREQAASGQTKKAFCRQRGVSLQTFYGWSKRGELRQPAFAQVEVATAPQAAVEVLLPNGARIGIRHQGKRDDLVALVRGVAGC
jgi:transposase-like protein